MSSPSRGGSARGAGKDTERLKNIGKADAGDKKKQEPHRGDEEVVGAKEEEGLNNDGATQNLQDSFRKFRESRLAERRRASKEIDRKDPDRKARLRKAFVEQCKNYLGVPYAQRFHEPGTPEHQSPVFLDCCALVRRVLDDLSDDFGFRVGRWNQAYQFDTLPRALSFEQMEPGDLVFYSGVYYNSEARKQKHDMVHVEVYVGPGEETIGARWHRGKVQIFDSYKFTSTSYHSIKHHFRSIDDWLEGRCEVHCAEHKQIWNASAPWKPSAKSIFWSSPDAEDADLGECCGLEGAEGCGDCGDEKEVAEEVKRAEEVLQRQRERDEEEEDAKEGEEKNGDGEENGRKGRKRGGDGDAENPPRPGSSSSSSSSSPERAGGKGGRGRRGDAGVPSSSSSSSSSNSTGGDGTKGGGEKEKEREPACSLTSSSNLTAADNKDKDKGDRGGDNKTGKGDSSSSSSSAPTRERDRNRPSSLHPVSLAVSSPRGPRRSFCLRTFYACKGNNANLVARTLEKRGFIRRVDAKPRRPCNGEFLGLLWEELKSQIDYSQLGKPMQTMANHVEGLRMTTKTGMMEIVNELYPAKRAQMCSWYPMTFRVPQEILIWKSYRSSHPELAWIYKPRALNCGRGIFLVTDPDEVSASAHLGGGGIVQLYIERPLLIEGRKFDLRLFMLIARTSPLLVFYRDGYVRRCIAPYDPDDKSTGGLSGHLTNNAVQKKTTDYKEGKESSIWTLSEFQKFLVDNRLAPSTWIDDVLRPRVMEICTELLVKSAEELEPIPDTFELLGFDVLLDEKLNIYLLEVNANPALSTNTSILKKTITAVLNEALDLVFWANKRDFAVWPPGTDHVKMAEDEWQAVVQAEEERRIARSPHRRGSAPAVTSSSSAAGAGASSAGPGKQSVQGPGGRLTSGSSVPLVGREKERDKEMGLGSSSSSSASGSRNGRTGGKFAGGDDVEGDEGGVETEEGEDQQEVHREEPGEEDEGGACPVLSPPLPVEDVCSQGPNKTPSSRTTGGASNSGAAPSGGSAAAAAAAARQRSPSTADPPPLPPGAVVPPSPEPKGRPPWGAGSGMSMQHKASAGGGSPLKMPPGTGGAAQGGRGSGGAGAPQAGGQAGGWASGAPRGSAGLHLTQKGRYAAVMKLIHAGGSKRPEHLTRPANNFALLWDEATGFRWSRNLQEWCPSDHVKGLKAEQDRRRREKEEAEERERERNSHDEDQQREATDFKNGTDENKKLRPSSSSSISPSAAGGRGAVRASRHHPLNANALTNSTNNSPTRQHPQFLKGGVPPLVSGEKAKDQPGGGGGGGSVQYRRARKKRVETRDVAVQTDPLPKKSKRKSATQPQSAMDTTAAMGEKGKDTAAAGTDRAPPPLDRQLNNRGGAGGEFEGTANSSGDPALLLRRASSTSPLPPRVTLAPQQQHLQDHRDPMHSNVLNSNSMYHQKAGGPAILRADNSPNSTSPSAAIAPGRGRGYRHQRSPSPPLPRTHTNPATHHSISPHAFNQSHTISSPPPPSSVAFTGRHRDRDRGERENNAIQPAGSTHRRSIHLHVHTDPSQSTSSMNASPVKGPSLSNSSHHSRERERERNPHAHAPHLKFDQPSSPSFAVKSPVSPVHHGQLSDSNVSRGGVWSSQQQQKDKEGPNGLLRVSNSNSNTQPVPPPPMHASALTQSPKRVNGGGAGGSGGPAFSARRQPGAGGRGGGGSAVVSSVGLHIGAAGVAAGTSGFLGNHL